VAVCRRNRVRAESTSNLVDHSLIELAEVLADNRIDVLICGGISREERDFIEARRMEIIDNVVGSIDELLAAIQKGDLRPGFGLNTLKETNDREEPTFGADVGVDDSPIVVDCLACTNRVCMNGKRCPAVNHVRSDKTDDRRPNYMMEAMLDISFENERTLCRLSELIYFCLEMRYNKIGLAYCTDLEEPVEILVRVLRRFFKVYPVCCKIGGEIMSDTMTSPPAESTHPTNRQVACNPSGQAAVLNQIETDINVLVGLCMGADCILSRQSDAPVTTLFVKDKSLANNPIGAVYSDYYLKEALQAARTNSV
jgi:uncharacterized metal-binding protein